MGKKVKVWRIVLLGWILLGVIGNGLTGEGGGGSREYESFLPPNTLFFMKAKNLKASWETFQKTPYFKLFQDPDLLKFIERPKTKALAWLDQAAKEVGLTWNSLGLSWPGQMAFGLLRFPSSTVTPGGEKQWRVPLFLILEWEDGGKGLMGKAEEFLRQKPAEQARKFQEQAQGVPYTVFRFGGDTPMGELAYAHLDKHLILTTASEVMPEILGYVKAKEGESLATAPGFREAKSRMGEAWDSLVYVDMAALTDQSIKLAVAQNPGGMDPQPVVRAFGLDNLAWGMMASGASTQSYFARGFLKFNGPKRGLFQFLQSSESEPALPNLVPEDWGRCSSLVWKPATLIPMIKELATVIGPGHAGAIQNFLEMLKARTQLDLQKDVLEKLGNSIQMYTFFPKPEAGWEERTVMLFPVREKQDVAAQLHKPLAAFFPGKVEEKEYLGQKYWSLALAVTQKPVPGGKADGEAEGEAEEQNKSLALGQIGDRLVITVPGEAMQDHIRLMGKEGGKNPATCPEMAKILASMPAGKVLVTLSDNAKMVKVACHALKNMAAFLPLMVPTLGDWVDLQFLPAPEKIARYFGKNAGALAETPDGFQLSSGDFFPEP